MKDNKREQLKNLTKKYFWKQKLIEITIIILSLIAFYSLSYFGSWIDGKYFKDCSISYNGCIMNTFGEHIMYSLLGLLLLAMLFVVLIIVGGLLYWWIANNWKKAKRKAKKELKIK
jgi:uncharacterized membrane protein YdjX (TVP38/TMEM64 family)